MQEWLADVSRCHIIHHWRERSISCKLPEIWALPLRKDNPFDSVGREKRQMFCLCGSMSWRKIYLTAVRTPCVVKTKCHHAFDPSFLTATLWWRPVSCLPNPFLSLLGTNKSTFPEAFVVMLCDMECEWRWSVCSSPLSGARCQCQGHSGAESCLGQWMTQTAIHPPPSMNWLDFMLAKSTVLKCLAKPPRSWGFIYCNSRLYLNW